jgi:outer membrane murein-binding lipoprotein Lpp
MRSIKLLPLVASLAAAALLAGCASTGYQKGDKTAANIQAAADQIGSLPGLIDKTVASLNDIVQKPAADLRPQYKSFTENLTAVESTAKSVADTRRAMGEKDKEFFAKWDEQLAQIKNEDIKARSQSRKDEVKKNLLAIKRSYTEAEMAFKPFMSDLKDVQKYLSVDLTPGGVASIKDTVGRVTQSAPPLKTCIGKLADDFKTLGVSMSSVTPAAPAPAQ